MADLSKIVCLEQDCRHGTEQTGGSGSGNDTYTKAEIDSKDAAVKAIADKAQSTATSAATAAADAQSVNHTQDRKIADLQKAAHTHSNKDIIDKTEQPFTTADQAKLNSLENYEHPTHKANSKGFYKFASDDLGHVSETEAVTKKDITDLGIPGTDTKYDRTDLYNLGCALRSDIDPSTYAGELPLCFAKAGLSEGLATLKDLVGGLEEIAYIRLYGWSDKKREAWLIVGGDGNLGCLCLHGKYSNPYIIKTPSDEDKVVGHTYILPAGKDGTFALTSDIPDISGKQDKLTAGANITFSGNTISAKDTTYSNATTSKAGLMSATDKTNLNANTLARHTHSNKATLDKLTDAQLTKLDGIDPDLYLPKAGGVMTGNIDLASNGVDLLVGTQRAMQGTYSSAVAGAAIGLKEPLETGLPKRKSLIGSWLDQNSVWHNILSVRHRNGWNDGPNYGFYLRSLLISNGSLFWNKQIGAGKWQGERVLLDSTNYSSYAAKSDHTHAMITNSALWVSGADNTAKWVRLGTLVSSGNFSNGVIRVWTGNGANGRANQNAYFEIQIKDGWQSTESATKACGVTVYRINCSGVKVKVIPTAHDTYTVWAYMPWTYWNGNYAVYGKYKSWTSQQLIQSDEPEGTAADTAYYDQAFLTSTVAKATEATAITETAWTDVPETNISPRYGKNIKYLKSGNTVYVRGSISFSQNLNNPCCGTMPSDLLPDDYQDHVFTAWNLLGGVPTAYPVVLAKDGKITLMNPTSTAQWFVAGRAYNFNFNYHIG